MHQWTSSQLHKCVYLCHNIWFWSVWRTCRSPFNARSERLDFIQALLFSLQVHNLELSKFVCIVTDGTPSVTGYKIGVVSLLYKYMHELGLQNELIEYHCIIHQWNLIEKAVGFKKIMTNVISALIFIRWHEPNQSQFKAFLDKIESECGDMVYYCEVCRCRKCKILLSFILLLKKFKVFAVKKGQPVSHFEDASWVHDLASWSILVDT